MFGSRLRHMPHMTCICHHPASKKGTRFVVTPSMNSCTHRHHFCKSSIAVMAYACHMRHVSESAAKRFSDLLSCSSIISWRSVIVISLQTYLTTSTEPLVPYTNVIDEGQCMLPAWSLALARISYKRLGTARKLQDFKGWTQHEGLKDASWAGKEGLPEPCAVMAAEIERQR